MRFWKSPKAQTLPAHKKVPHSPGGGYPGEISAINDRREAEFFPSCADAQTHSLLWVPLRTAWQSQEHEGAIQIAFSSRAHPTCGRFTVCFLAMR